MNGSDAFSPFGPSRFAGLADERAGAGVSAVICVRNGARYLETALASVYRSTVQPREVLILDGNSSDDTCAIAARFPLVRIISQRSRGIPGAYNEAVENAVGEFIAFLSHDDYWLPGKLDRHLAVMRENPALDYTTSLVEHFLDEGAIAPEGFRTELLGRGVPGSLMEALVVRPRAFAKIGGFDPRFTAGEDTDWFARAKDSGLPTSLIPEVLVRKRVHGSNYSINAGDLNRHLLRALRQSIARKRDMPIANVPADSESSRKMRLL
jgi:glycosyltransferase involved in cell wall biosynthesis